MIQQSSILVKTRNGCFSQFTLNLTYNSPETVVNSIKRQEKNFENLILTQ